MQKKLPTIILLFVVVSWLVPLVHGFDNASKAPQQVKVEYTSQMAGNFLGGHDTITAEGLLLKKQVHYGDDRFKQWADRDAASPLRIGAHDEDTNQLLNFILRDPPLGPNGWGDFYSHFYDSRIGDDAENAIGRQATKAVKDYLEKIKELTNCTSKGFETLSPGDKTRVYDYLGRITHLYQDMFCPSHVKVEAHPFHHPFEQYINDKWGEIIRSSSFQDRVTTSAYLKGNYDIGSSINPIQAMKATAEKSRAFWGEEALCDLWDEQKSSCLLINSEKLQQNVNFLVPEAVLSTAGYIDSIYRAAKATPDYRNICLPKPLQGPGGDHPDDRFDVSDAFYWKDRFNLSEMKLNDLFMRTGLKKGKTGVWYGKRLKELYGKGRGAPSDMPISEKTKIYNEFKTVHQKLNEKSSSKDWLTSPDIALFAYGFYNEAISLMIKINEPARFLDLDFDPAIVQDHPVLLIPTAGLAGYEQSATLKAKLEEYVRLGGTLVVFAQQLGHHWNILPTPVDLATGEAKSVSGYGYQQDQNCQQGSVFIENNHAMLSSFASATIDVGVDGYLCSYPDNSTILLRRSANGQPAMILYPYGNGHVIVTALYTDFAFSRGQANKYEIDLVANIISWAKKPAELPQVKPGETISLNIPVTNNMDSNASSVKLRIYNPTRSLLLSEHIIAGSVPASESTIFVTQFTIPGNGEPGIYRADYVLLDTQGDIIQPQTENDFSRFVVNKPSTTGSPDKPIWFSVTTTSQNVPFGATFDYTFHVYNNSDEIRHLTIKSIFGHTKRPHEWHVTVRPKAVTTISGSDIFEDRVNMYDTMRAFLYDELNQMIGRYELSFKGFYPHAYIKLSSNKQVYSNNEDVALKVVTTTGQTGAYTIKTTILGPDNTLQFEDNRTLNLSSGSNTIVDIHHHLAANSNPGSYIARSEIWKESRFLSSASTSFELPRSQIVITFNEPQSFKVGANLLSFGLRNNGKIDIRSGTFTITLTDPHSTVIYEGSHSFSLTSGKSSTLTIPISIPNLYFGDYIITYLQSDETKNGSVVSLHIPNSATIGLLLDKPSYRIRESANISATIINTGKFDLDNLQATLSVYSLAFQNTKIANVAKGQNVALNFSIPIPENAWAGSHFAELYLAAPSGDSMQQTTVVSIPDSSLKVHFNGPNTLNPGDNIALSIENIGGVDAEYIAERLSLTDNNGTAIHNGTANGIVRVGEVKSFYEFQIPNQVVRGDVMLNVAVKDNNTGLITNFLKSFLLSGLEARIETKTDKNLYAIGESTVNTTDIINLGSHIENANLDLLVYKLKAGVEGQFSHVLPKGWLPLIQPTDIASDSEGYLYVVDVEDRRLIKIQKNGSFVKEFNYMNRCLGGGREVCQPYSVAASPDGFIYVVDKGSSWYLNIHNCIHKFDREGNFLDSWPYCNSGPGFSLDQPSGIAVGRDGSVYVTDTYNHRVVKFSSEGTFISAWGSRGKEPGKFVYPEGIATDSSGNVYVTDTEGYGYNSLCSHRVQKFDMDGNFITQWGGYGTKDGLFMNPLGIAVDANGYVYVSDSSQSVNKSYRIQKFDSNGVFVKSWGGEGRIEGKFVNPKGLAVDEDGYVYVADSGNGRIQKFSADGDFISLWGGRGLTNGFLAGPESIGVDAQDNIYVADHSNYRIQKYDKNGNYIKQWGSIGTGDGQFFCGPKSIAVSKEGFIYVPTCDRKIQKFNSEGDFQTSWGEKGTDDGKFSGLLRIAVSTGGYVYVSDDEAKRIQKFDSNGTFIAKWGNRGSGPGQINEIRGISVSPDGMVYVADAHRIQKFGEDGIFLLEWGAEGTNAGQFKSIARITVDSMGFVYTVELNPIRIQKFDGAGNFITQWVEGEGDIVDAFRSVSGIAIDSDGSILISDSYRHRICRLTPLGTDVVFQKSFSLSQPGNTNQQYNNTIGAITRCGTHYCEATLKNSLGQTISKSFYPFYVASGDVAILMSIEKKNYKPGEQIRISGEVVNMSDTPLSGYNLNITKLSSLGVNELFLNDFDLPARGIFPFSFTFSELREGKYVLTATVQNASLKVADASEHYEVHIPTLSTEIISPDIASDQPFSLDVVMRNTGDVDANVNLSSSINEETFSLSMAPGSTRVITYSQHISEDTLYRFTISGDVNETLEKMVYQGLATSVYVYAANVYPEGKVAIPISVENPGLLDGKISLDIDLQPTGYSFQKNYFVPRWSSASDNLIFDLAEGEYTLTLTSQAPPASTTASFSVRRENNVTMAPLVIGTLTNGFVAVSSEFVNHGYRDVNGTIQLSLLNAQGGVEWESSNEVNLPASLSPTPVPANLSFPSSIIQIGNYTVKVVLLNETQQELASQTAPIVISGASLHLVQVPSIQTVPAGEEAMFTFVVANTGGKEAQAELTLRSHDFINLTQRVTVSPGEQKNIQFAFPIPADLEEKDYYAEYELKDRDSTSVKGQVKYHVTGINISVAASLDKEHYREGETAHLALIVSEQSGGGTRNLFARVNYGDFESKQNFTLTGNQNLSFTVPLTAITGEKLFFGIYDEGGRSIHLNSLYIYKAGDALTITTNKQVYNLGETVNMTISGTGIGTMTISGPGGYSETFPFSGSAARNFVLPTFATAGTYYIEASLVTAEGQTVHITRPIDIAGISVKVKEASLDKGKYLPGEPLRLSMRIESNRNVAATLKVWSVDPDKTSIFLGEHQLSLTREEQLLLTTDYPTTITTSGIHKIIYGIYADNLLLSSGNLSFDAGGGVILGMMTDRIEYPLGSETVAVKFNILGTTDATLTLKLNGIAVHSETINLNGFTSVSLPLPDPGPGAHMVEGILSTDGLSSRKETRFLYGTNLPDLAADVWSSGTWIGKDGILKLFATVGNRGKTTTSSTSMTLHDGGTMLAAFSVGELVAGASQSFEFLWNVMGKAGEHTLVATIDPTNAITDFTRDNNQVSRRIVIPDIALVTEIDKDNYRMGEQVTINSTGINLTAGTNYPDLVCTTVVRDLSGNEVFRQSKPLGLSPSQIGVAIFTWSTSSVTTEGKYTIKQDIVSGATVLAERTRTVTIAARTGFGLRVDPASIRLKQGETGLFTVSVDAPSGWNNNVSFDVEGAPAGAIISFTPDAVTGPGTATLSIVTSAATPHGTYSIVVRGRNGEGSGEVVQATPVTIDISGFSLEAVPESLSISQQETAEFLVSAVSLNNYTGNVVLSDATGEIEGMIITVDSPTLTVPEGQAIVRVQSSKSLHPGAYTIKIIGSDGIITRDIKLSVHVTQSTDTIPGFVLTPGPGPTNRALVTLLNSNFEEKMEFTAFKTRFGANAVMGDIDGDGVDEIVVAPGPDPLADGGVRVFRQNGTLLFEQPVLATKFGAYLAAGDIDSDQREEIAVGAGPGLSNTAQVKVLSYNGHKFENTGIDFIAFPKTYKLGVKVALGDVDGDGILEIIAGAGPSPLSPARVKVFKVDTSGGVGNWSVSSTLSDFIVEFGDWYPYIFGVNVAAGDVDGDGMAEIIAGAGPNPLQKAVVAVYRGDGTFTGTRFEAYPSNEYRFGVNVAARDLDGDGLAEIITGPGPSPFSDSWIRIFRGDGTLLSDGFFAYPESMKFGSKVSIGTIGE